MNKFPILNYALELRLVKFNFGHRTTDPPQDTKLRCDLDELVLENITTHEKRKKVIFYKSAILILRCKPE